MSFLRGLEKPSLMNLKISSSMMGGWGSRTIIWLSTLGGGVNSDLSTMESNVTKA